MILKLFVVLLVCLEFTAAEKYVADNGTITCLHGENECFISRAQACAFYRPEVTQKLAVEFLYCTEAKAAKGDEVVDSDIEACVDSVLANVVSYQTIQACMNGKESGAALKSDYEKTIKYGIEFVPWLTLFGVRDDETDILLNINFVGTICSMLLNPPNVCYL